MGNVPGRYHTKRCNSHRGPQYPCDCGNPKKPDIAAWNARTTDAEIERLTKGWKQAFDIAYSNQADNERLRSALELALEYWRHRQQRYKNRHPAWVKAAREALASTSASHVLAVVEAARKLRDAADEGRSMNAAQSAMLIADAMKAVIESVRRLDTGTGATQEGKSDV